MAIGTTNISLGNIYGEVNNTLPGGTNVSLKTQSQNAANTGHTSTISGYTSPGGGLTGAPYGMGEFGGYVNLSIDNFPSLSTGYTTTDLSGSTSNTQFSFQKAHASGTYGIQVAAFASMQFNHDTANDRIIIRFFSGTNANATTVFYQAINYVGLGSATWECRYLYPDITTAMPTYDSDGTGNKAQIYLPTTDSRAENTWYSIPTSGYTQFYHRALANYSSLNDNGHAIVGSSSVFGGFGEDVRFEVRATSGSNTFTATSIDYSVLLEAKRGTGIIEP